MLLDTRLRHLTTYLYVQDLLAGAHVLEVGAEGHGDFLRGRGARSVGRAQPADVRQVVAGEFDVAFALDADPAGLRELVEALKRAVKPEGTIVVGVASRDRPGAREGASYYELTDLLEAQFPSLRMIGQAPFVGSTLVEYGIGEPEPVLDGTLVPKGERVEWYVAICGPKRAGSRGYGVMQVPLGEVQALPAERRVAPTPEPVRAAPPRPIAAKAVPPDAGKAAPPPAARTAPPPAARAAPPPAAKPAPQPPAPPREPGYAEMKQLVAAAEKGKAELQDFVLTLKQQLSERDAALAELDGERREIGGLRESVRAAEQRADKAEAAERESRKKLAEAEGTILKLRAGGVPSGTGASAADTVAAPAAPSPDVAALQAEIEKWKQKESDSRAEAWKAHKQRADAEAQAAEVREDTVRKLKDARKLASLDLTRATEEAMKKAVTLKEELTRTERERKELVAEVKRLNAELETVRTLSAAAASAEVTSSASAASSVVALGGPDAAVAPGPDGDVALRGRVSALERELMNADAIAAADRARSAQLMADMERESQERSDVTVRLRHSLRERDREVAALRHDLSERDARLTALEQRSPPSDEIERLEAEVATARMRLGTAMQELARKEAQVERASAAAAHERARAERMMTEQRHAQDAVAHARGRAAEAERQLDVARERLGRLELELKGEAERVGALEQAVRRAVDSARNGHGGPA